MDTPENVAGLVDEYRTLFEEADSSSSDALETALVDDAEWTPEADGHLLQLARENGSFILRNALAISLDHSAQGCVSVFSRLAPVCADGTAILSLSAIRYRGVSARRYGLVLCSSLSCWSRSPRDWLVTSPLDNSRVRARNNRSRIPLSSRSLWRNQVVRAESCRFFETSPRVPSASQQHALRTKYICS